MRSLSEVCSVVSDSSLQRLFHAFTAIYLGTSLLSGCGLTSNALKKAESDPSLVTGSVAPETPVDLNRQSDEATIRNAVSSANLDAIGGKPLAWANQGTGSRGAVSKISEIRNEGQICRKFETSRESFEGIALFGGKTCLNDNGDWSMLNFDAL